MGYSPWDGKVLDMTEINTFNTFCFISSPTSPIQGLSLALSIEMNFSFSFCLTSFVSLKLGGNSCLFRSWKHVLPREPPCMVCGRPVSLSET